VTPEEIKTQKSKDKVKYWLTEIDAARKREQDWRKEGKRVQEIYNGKKKDSIPFNILYSNTETLQPALYNATPRPVVQRRFKDDDPLGKISATAGQRVLEFLVDTNSEEYQNFDDVLGDAILDALLPGRGASWVRYDASVEGELGARSIKYETICFESLKWDRWIHGYAKKWNRVPWVAKEHDVTVEEAEQLFGKAAAAKLTFNDEQRSEDRADDSDQEEDSKTNEQRKVAKVWELWIKDTKRVVFVSPNYAEDFLKEDDDPLQLTGFFPMPKPLRFLRKANNLEPTPLYSLYENQARELNRLTVRINKVAEAIKIRGAYDGTLGGDIESVLKLEDGQMKAAENVAALNNTKGLEGAIWLMPIDKLIVVLQQLFQAREQCKQVIFEITGIADIMRGQSKASETLGAQQLKNQWGTLRIKRLQKDVANYARDMLRITLEIAAKKFQQEQTWAQMTALPFTTQPQVQQAQGQVAAARSMLATRGQIQPGMPPQQTMQLLSTVVPQAMQALQQPQWAQVLALLRNDTQRAYRIDVETNSTVDPEATEDKQLMGEVLAAVSQFLQGVGPLVISGAMPFEVAQSMLLAIVRRYRFGTEIEDYIKQMKPPQDPNAGQQAAEMQMKQQEHAQKMQQGQQKLDHEKELAAMELEMKREELRLKKVELQMKHQAKVQEMELQRQQGEQTLRQNAQQGALDLSLQQAGASIDQQAAQRAGDQKLEQDRKAGDQKLAQQKAQQAAKPKPKPGATT
jgi:hypothetical protein